MEGEDGEEWRKLPCEDRIAHKVIDHLAKIEHLVLQHHFAHLEHLDISFSSYSIR